MRAVAKYLILLSAVTPVSATTITWGRAGGGVFNDGANWVDGVAPTLSDLAVFGSTNVGLSTISFTSDATTTVDSINFRNTTAGAQLKLKLINGTFTVSKDAIVGMGSNQQNDVIFQKGNFVPNILKLGNTADTGTTTFTVLGGGTLVAGGIGTLASSSIRIGSNGGSYSSLVVKDGGYAESKSQTIIGLQGASHNSLTVTGTNARFYNEQSISLGDNNSSGNPQTDNQINIENGAFAQTRELIMGTSAGSDHNTVRVSNATFTILGEQQASAPLPGQQMDIGRKGSYNKLQIDNGGTVLGKGLYLMARDTVNSLNNSIELTGGSLTGYGVRINNGTLLLNNGTVTINRSVQPDVNGVDCRFGGVFEANGANAYVNFNTGKINSYSAVIRNSRQFVIGDGTSTNSATYRMVPDNFGTAPHYAGGANEKEHNFENGLKLSANGVLEGTGTIDLQGPASNPTTGAVTGDTGAKVYVGLQGNGAARFGKIDVIGQWNNRRITLALDVGNLSGSPVAGTSYDLLDIHNSPDLPGTDGSFVHGSGSAFVIDTSMLVQASSSSWIRLVGWESQVSPGMTTVSFVNGAELWTHFDNINNTGFYVSTRTTATPAPPFTSGFILVPEPSSLAAGVFVGTVALSRRKRHRA